METHQGGEFIPHKADESFFQEKRPWSKRKDDILAAYLVPYLPKIATQGRPILIVDAFAGPGSFGDGNRGSPRIIGDIIGAAMRRSKPLPVDCQLLAVESNPVHFKELSAEMAKYPFAQAMHGRFQDALPSIANKAANSSVFLYIDPFTVEGLNWESMDSVFSLVGGKRSVEVLMNFNVAIFARRGFQLLALTSPINPDCEDVEPIDMELSVPPTIRKLNEIVGGDWWRSILQESNSMAATSRGLTEGLAERLKKRFHEVCYHPVKAMPHHTVPKYTLFFGSRHPDALLLMNDAMIKSRDALASMADCNGPTLFEMRSEELVPDESRLPDLLKLELDKPRKRGDVIVRTIRRNFCEFSLSRIRQEITKLLKSGAIVSETGLVRINDETVISLPGGKKPT